MNAWWQQPVAMIDTAAMAAAQAWLGWEDGAATLLHEPDATSDEDPARVLAKARIEADVDYLTRLPNRRAFERRLAISPSTYRAQFTLEGGKAPSEP